MTNKVFDYIGTIFIGVCGILLFLFGLKELSIFLSSYSIFLSQKELLALILIPLLIYALFFRKETK